MDKVLFIEGYHEMTRPADIPADWTIYNAPRPLYGHKRWQGDFRHGIFFAAVAPRATPPTSLAMRRNTTSATVSLTVTSVCGCRRPT